MLSVFAAGSDRRAAALSVLFSQLPSEERDRHVADILRAADQGEFSLEGLLLAEADGHPVGAGLSIVQSDQTAFVWPPVVLASVSLKDSVADAILEEMHRRLDSQGIWMSQCLIDPKETTDRAILVRNGFEHFADISIRIRDLRVPLPAQTADRFETIVFDPPRNGDRFARILERTYIGSLDCPRLGRLRSGHEALASHRLTGQFSPALWRIYRIRNADVGVLLLTDHPDQDAWEVVYMGILPEWRGQGLGRSMLLSGLHEARAAGRAAVLLAVDAINIYAKALYDDLGFVEADVRAIHIRISPHRRPPQ